jgi:hypothetical protein
MGIAADNPETAGACFTRAREDLRAIAVVTDFAFDISLKWQGDQSIGWSAGSRRRVGAWQPAESALARPAERFPNKEEVTILLPICSRP